MIIVGQPQYLADGDYVDLGNADIPNGVTFVNPDVANVVCVNAEIDNGDSFLPLAVIPAANTPGYGTLVPPGGSVTIELNTRGVADAYAGNLIVSTDGGAAFFTPVKV
jgi:hypothetical protein